MFHIKAKRYEGYVSEILEDGFVGIINELNQIVEFPNSILSEEDARWLSEAGVGAIFDWDLGPDYSCFSFFKERWTQEELDEAKEKARKWMSGVEG